MTIVDHTRDHDLTVQGSQAARARAIQRLTEGHNLPTVTWTIGDIDGVLTGTAFRDVINPSAPSQREVVETWAAYLHSSITEKGHRGSVEICAEGWAYGVRVRICARIRPATPKEAAA